MKELQDGELLNSTTIKANAESTLGLSFDAVAMVTSLYVSQKVNEHKPDMTDFKVVFVKEGKAISVDEMIGNVLTNKVIEFLADDVTKIYDVVKIVQQELEQWDIDLVYKAKFYA